MGIVMMMFSYAWKNSKCQDVGLIFQNFGSPQD